MKANILKITLNTLLLAGIGLTVQAQKLKDVQEVSVLAPENIKVDGKNTEWNDTFMAQNKRTNIFYTLSNDDKNLYMAIKSTDVGNNTKILAGGITLSINPDGKRKEKESITLTYPVINRANRGMPGGGGGGRRASMGIVMSASTMGGGAPSAKQRDSSMAAMQKTQLAQVKEIKIKGFKNTTDTLISIYNEFGIKAFASIDKDNALFYELAIPLEALGITADSAQEFAYNVKVNGLQMPNFDGGGFGGGGRGGSGGFGGGGGGMVVTGGGGGGGRGGSFDWQSMFSPTDFWGKYTLKKK